MMTLKGLIDSGTSLIGRYKILYLGHKNGYINCIDQSENNYIYFRRLSGMQ